MKKTSGGKQGNPPTTCHTDKVAIGSYTLIVLEALEEMDGSTKGRAKQGSAKHK